MAFSYRLKYFTILIQRFLIVYKMHNINEDLTMTSGEELNKHSCFRSDPIVCFMFVPVYLVVMYSLFDDGICLN